MEVSYKFRNIESHLLSFYDLILKNQSILKYIYFLDDNPLIHSDINQTIIENCIKKNIILTPVDRSVLKDEKVVLFISPDSGNLGNMATGDLTYRFDILVPHTKWVLNGLGKLRPFRIADEFAQKVDGQPVTGISNCTIGKFQVYRVTEEYSCLFVPIGVTGTSMKGLKDG